MSFHYCGFDASQVIHFDSSGKRIYNIFEIALQAMIGVDVALEYNSESVYLVPRLFPLRDLSDPRKDRYAMAASKWLEDNEVSLSSDVSVWHYDFDWKYKGKVSYAPWVSAFGQAYVIFSQLHWHHFSGDEAYLARAQRAAHGLILPIGRGGCGNYLSEDTLFFEEIPKVPTHIFNAHLVSLLALILLEKRKATKEISTALTQGLRAFEKMSPWMDTGAWSAYDTPDSVDVGIQILPQEASSQLEIASVKFQDIQGERTLDLGKDTVFNSHINRAAGIDWGQVVGREGRRYRSVTFGPAIHETAVPTGTRQNTYLYFDGAKIGEADWQLSIDLRVARSTQLKIAARNTLNGEWTSLQIKNKSSITLPKGHSKIQLALLPQLFNTPVSDVYHRFHIQLLDELYLETGRKVFKNYTEKFRAYSSAAKKPEEKFIEKAAKLQTLYLGVNSVCGLTCKMCDFGISNKESSLFKALQPERPALLIDPKLVIDRCVEALPDLKTVHFIGTEPLFHPKIVEMVSGLKKHNFHVILTTNGISLAKTLLPLLDQGLDELWISLDGPSEIHDDIRGREGLFDLIAQALNEHASKIEVAKARGFRLCVSTAINPLNFHCLDRLISETKNIPFDYYHFTHLNYVTNELAQAHNQRFPEYRIFSSTITEKTMARDTLNPYVLYRSLKQAELLAEKLDRSFSVVPRLDFTGLNDHYFEADRQVGSSVCHVPESCLEVASNGQVSVMARCYQFEIGNIKTTSLQEIFHGNSMIKFRDFLDREGLQPPCFRCCGIMQ